jgi:hypothetical protein
MLKLPDDIGDDDDDDDNDASYRFFYRLWHWGVCSKSVIAAVWVIQLSS